MEYELGIRLDRLEVKIDLLLKAAGYVEEPEEPKKEKDTKQKTPHQEKTD